MSDTAEDLNKKCVYVGGLSPVLQKKFLAHWTEAEGHGVSAEAFVTAWNSYALTIEEHVFITDTPGKAQGPQ